MTDRHIDSDSDDAPLASLADTSGRSKRKVPVIDSDDEPLAKKAKKSPKPPAKKTVTKKTTRVTKTKSKKGKTTKSKTKTTKTVSKRSSSGKKNGAEERKLKTLSKMETLEMAIKARRWWNDEPLPEGLAWRSLAHNGVLFPTPYKPLPKHVKLLYDGKPVDLTPEQEEVAYFYAAIPLDGPQLGNPKTAAVFNKNFFKDLKALLGKGHVIKEFSKCDFTDMRAYQEEQRALKKEMTKEEKEPEKKKKEQELFKHGYAIVDGSLEKVGNFRIEPPGLFRGRGDHPKTGTLKKRVMPEEVTINIGADDMVPPCPIPGHSWKEIIHRDTVTWLAYWNENVMGGTKYVWLAASSSFKGKSDMEKYEKARLLKKYIDKIRADYVKGLSAKDKLVKQRSTAMWVIDILALRVGNEKGEDEADTVGCCSLRCEHLQFNDDAKELRLSFLGKDSMPYENTIDMTRYGDVGLRVYQNLRSFVKGKKAGEDVFDFLSTSDLNKHLGSLMPGLSAKVFRTFNASITLQNELPKKLEFNLPFAPKVVTYNDANRKVAILCNHQRTVPKGFEAQMGKLEEKYEQLKKQLKELQDMLKKVKAGKKVKTKSGTEDPEKKKAEAHLTSKQPSVEQLQKRVASWKQKITATELQIRNKNDNKEVALGTSKINYMDPRITVAWCKRNEVPIEKVFPRTLREKFVWAMEVDANWEF